MMFIPDLGSGFFSNSDPNSGSRGKKHRILDPDPQHWIKVTSSAEVIKPFTFLS
jgi:hypothetical protein